MTVGDACAVLHHHGDVAALDRADHVYAAAIMGGQSSAAAASRANGVLRVALRQVIPPHRCVDCGRPIRWQSATCFEHFGRRREALRAAGVLVVPHE